jgi:hypothetical protein
VSRSRIQEPFLREVAAHFQATEARIARRIAEKPAEAPSIVKDEMRGLYHGLFVIFDGGTALADDGLINIVDEDGETFDRFLHEICLAHWPETDA